MIATPPRRARTRSRALLCALLLPVLVLLGGTTLPTLGATAAAATVRPAEVEAGQVSVQITAITPQVLRPDQDLVVTAVVRNAGPEEIADPRATLRVNRIRPSSSEELSSWADAEVTADAGKAVGPVVALGAPLAAGASAEVVLTVPASSVALLRTPDAWGPRGLAVELTDAGRRVGLDRSFVLWLPSDDVPAAQVSLLVPIVGDAVGSTVSTVTEPEPDPEREPTPAQTPSDSAATADPTLEELTGPGGRLRTVLDAIGRHHEISWAIDPSLVARADAGGPVAAGWLADLGHWSAQRDIFVLPWADPDLGAIAHADQPELLDVALTAASDALEASSTVLLSDQLTGLQWPVEDVPDRTTASLVAGAGADVIVLGPEAMPEQSRAGRALSAVTTVGTGSGDLLGLVPDAGMTAALSDPDALDGASTPATAAQRLLAESAVSAHRPGGIPHLLATVPRDWAPDPVVVQAQLDALAAAPWLELTPTTGLIGTGAGDAEREPLPTRSSTELELSRARVSALSEARTTVSEFATVLADPSALTTGMDRLVLAPLSSAWRAEPDARDALVEDVLAEAQSRKSGLSVVVSPQVTVINSSAPLRFPILNALSQDATVRLELAPTKACLTVPQEPGLVTVPAGSETVVTVEVRALANCDVDVDVRLVAADGSIVATPARFNAQLSPSIENVGTAVVGGLLTLGLLFGIFRTVRRGQTAHRGARAVADATPADALDALDPAEPAGATAALGDPAAPRAVAQQSAHESRKESR